MKLNLYVVRDVVLEQSWPIAEAKNDGMALRNYQKVLSENEFKDDFELYQVGWYDHDTDRGEFLSAPRLVRATISTEVEDDGI